MIIAFVSLLLSVSCPTAVFWGITSIIINPVNRMLVGRALPHISQKPLEGKPLVTDTNTPEHVPVCTPRVGVCGAGLHVGPATVGAGEAFAMRSETHLVYGLRPLFTDAPARNSGAFLSQKIRSGDSNLLPTRTRADAQRGPAWGRQFLFNEKSSESFPKQAFDSGLFHTTNILVLAHGIDGLSSSGSQTASTAGSRALTTTTCSTLQPI